MILAVNNLTKSYGGKDIIKNISFHIEAHDRLAVTGANGAGKTTLLKQIVGEESPDSGSVTVSKDVSIGYLTQMIEPDKDISIYDEVISIKKDLLELEKEIRRLEEQMSTDHSPELIDRYEKLNLRFEMEGGYALNSNVTGILKGLGFNEDEFSRKVSELSGGQKTRLALGRLLLSSPDILILDEPTNHLDIVSAGWLENYLKASKNAVIIVSHDRYFLDRIVNKVFDIENGKGTMYTGNYTAFASKKAALRKERMRAYLNNQAEIKHQQEVIEKLRQFNREKSIKRAESREKALAKIERVEKPFDIDDAMRLHFTPSKLSGKDVLFADGLKKSYGENILFEGTNLDIKRGEKVAVIGPNGAGKTTLLKILAGVISPDKGEVELGSRVETAYYDQEHHVLDHNNTVFDEISDAYPNMNNTEIRNLLASFLFTGDDVFKYVRDLSGGEKGRLSLVKLMLSKANLLLLDEPTNHLDITSKEILEEAVRNYEGTVIYVSHDRYFINVTATRILELYNRSFINYQGNYDYYLEKISDPSFDRMLAVSGGSGLHTSSNNKSKPDADILTKTAAAFSQGKNDYQAQKEKKQQLQKLKNAVNTCEKNIAENEDKIKNIEAQMALPENAVNSAKLNELNEKLKALGAELETLYEEWERLSGELEAKTTEV